MVIVKIEGGLGNQMFQYAIARVLSIKNNTDLKLDITDFEHYPLHKYSLGHFKIVENFATEGEVNSIKNKYPSFWSRLRGKKSDGILQEKKEFVFDQSIFDIKRDVYLSGYWQNEHYFSDYEDIIKNDFEVKTSPKGKNIEMLEKIQSSNSVSLHIRRGDFISNKVTHQKHGTCNLDYYQRAISFVTSKVHKTEFFIFSDDIEWAKKNLRLKHKTNYIDFNNSDTNYEDLRLMMNCKHDIIANSTFSWWGAWLNRNKKKIVISPQEWFNKAELDTSDLIPQEWTKL